MSGPDSGGYADRRLLVPWCHERETRLCQLYRYKDLHRASWLSCIAVSLLQSHFIYNMASKLAAKAPATFKVALRGDALLTSPRWSKGTAFTHKERARFGLTGRLPYEVNTLEQQCSRAYNQLKDHESDLRKNAFLMSLKAQNWVLYYSLISKHLKELMPIIYTPTEVCSIWYYHLQCDWWLFSGRCNCGVLSPFPP